MKNQEPLEPQERPQLAPEPKPDEEEERKWWGPYTTLIERRISNELEHYYVPPDGILYVANPGEKPRKVVVLRVLHGSAINDVMKEAWSRKTEVSVYFGFPWVNRTLIAGEGATVRQAELIRPG